MKDALFHVTPVLSLIPDARPYAITDYATQSLAAVIAAKSGMTNGGLGHKEMASWLSKEMRPHLRDLFQQKPVVGELPKPWIDQVTGRDAANPFDKATWHLPSQALLKTVAPVLAEHLESIANGGLNYEFLHTFNSKREQAKAVADYEYNAKSHANNPWCGKQNYAIQQKVRDTNPMLAEFLARESAPLVAVHFFGPLHVNLSKQGMVEKVNPEAAALLRRAALLHKSWLQEVIDNSAAQERRAGEQKRQAESQLLGR